MTTTIICSSFIRAVWHSGLPGTGREGDAKGMMQNSVQTTDASPARVQFAFGQCSLGAILVAQSPRGLCAIGLGDDPEVLLQNLQLQFPKAWLVGGDAQFERLLAQVISFVERPSLGLHLPLDSRGTIFQERVWQALREIPPGATVSYKEIAEQIGAPRAVRAVAGACAANCLAVAIPCHRVVRRDGALSGYRWGVERKRALLCREREVENALPPYVEPD